MVDLHRRVADEDAATTAVSLGTASELLDTVELPPTLRIRIEHSRTIKDGWSYATSVTLDGVEITDAFADVDIEGAGSVLTLALLKARTLGEQERDLRNQRDNALKQATSAGE